MAEAHSINEVKGIHAKAAAMEAYARQAKDIEFQIWATEKKLRAERMAGAMLDAAEKAQGKRTDLVTSRDQVDGPLTLADPGVTKSESSRWQQKT